MSTELFTQLEQKVGQAIDSIEMLKMEVEELKARLERRHGGVPGEPHKARCRRLKEELDAAGIGYPDGNRISKEWCTAADKLLLDFRNREQEAIGLSEEAGLDKDPDDIATEITAGSQSQGMPQQGAAIGLDA